MKNLYRRIICIVFMVCFFAYTGNYAYSATSTVAKQPVKTQAKVTNPITSSYITVSPLDVVDNVPKYLNKNISFTAEFVAFTSLGLDYKPAFKDGAKYIGILIRRPDVSTHTIPLSEMKIFILRENAEKQSDIEVGDKIKISGKVFSDALGDPWVEVNTFTVLTQHKPKSENK